MYIISTINQRGISSMANKKIDDKDYGKLVEALKIINEDNKDEVFAKLKAKPFKKYGIMKSSFVIVNGSVTGSAKRLIRMRKAIRKINGSYDETVSIKSIN